jgi:lysophospholipase L1-like esterase
MAMRLVRIAFAVAVAATAVTAVTACSGTATSSAVHRAAAPASYYLALGDSLSQGVQPDAAGVSVKTGQGYPDQVYAALRPRYPSLRLVKLGCPGDTTSTMINGGICRYPDGSQLAAAVAFLRPHRGHVLLVTLDIGANDAEDCGSWASLQALSCARTGIPGAASRLSTIVQRLGKIPRNVALICQWTWECAAPPRGPNQHADRAGYGVIADAFLRTAGLQLPLMARRRRRTPPPALAVPAPSLTVRARGGKRTA